MRETGEAVHAHPCKVDSRRRPAELLTTGKRTISKRLSTAQSLRGENRRSGGAAAAEGTGPESERRETTRRTLGVCHKVPGMRLEMELKKNKPFPADGHEMYTTHPRLGQRGAGSGGDVSISAQLRPSRVCQGGNACRLSPI